MAFSLSPRAAAAGYRLAAFDTIGSTNEEGLARARAGEGGPLWLVSSEQTAGRGRRGNPWQTSCGNLAASLLLVTTRPSDVIAQLGFVAGLALVRALDAALGSHPGAAIALKWPNDVLAGGRKLAGILLQTEGLPSGGRAVVVGIGVNLRHEPEGVPYPTTSLRTLGADLDAQTLFGALSDAWLDVHALWDDGRGFAAIRERWLARAAGLAGEVSVRIRDDLLEGRFETIDELGQLVIRAGDGSARHVSAGEVHFGGAGSARAEARP